MDQMYLHGGIERILSQKINYLIDHFGYEVYLITTEQKNQKSVYDLSPKVIWKDLNINYHREISYFHPKNIWKTIIHFFKLNKVLKQIHPNIIVSVSTSPEQYFLPFIQTQIPKIKEFHSSRYNYVANKNWKQKLDKTINKYEAIVVLNETEKQYYNNQNIYVIPNFTDFKPILDHSIAKKNTIIAAGRIAPVKQFQELIYIWKIIHKDFPDWKVQIFGDGEQKTVAHLQELIDELGLQQSFFLMPSVTNIQEMMNQASIYAMTSQSECFPMVLLEAQACSLPIISYDCPNGPRHIILDQKNGFLVEPNNRKLFAEKLSLLMNDENLRNNFGSQAQIHVSSFSKQKIMELWHELFTKTKK